jgi:hypothetical protein
MAHLPRHFTLQPVLCTPYLAAPDDLRAAEAR